MSYLANALTISSLFFGFASIIFSMDGCFTFAAWAIIVSVLCDGLDGQIARRTNSLSGFGKELDSLVDVISFGVAPACLGYKFIYQKFHLLAIAVLFVYLACSVIRLAKYNVTPKEKLTNYFYGLPTTASGGILASFILVYREVTRPPPDFILFFIVLALAFLMVSRVKYLNLDAIMQKLGLRAGVFLAVAGLAALIFFPAVTIFSGFSLYLFLSPFFVES